MLVHNLKVEIKESYKLAKENREYKTISTTQTITKEELEKYIAPFIGASASESLHKLSHASDFIPHRADIEIEAEKNCFVNGTILQRCKKSAQDINPSGSFHVFPDIDPFPRLFFLI
ncbi:MAG TPA: hypothetical protein GXX36_09810 [Clostridiaceae bacterium]|nr:hypothetical protein [Clostridiaceae bacterium]